MISKKQILAAIVRIAEEDGGAAPGMGTFQTRTGVRREDWLGVHWRSWGEAVTEAGLTPNTLQPRIDDDVLLRRYAVLARELGHPPTKADLQLARRRDRSIPSHTVFTRRFGSSAALRTKAREYCRESVDLADVVSLLEARQDDTHDTDALIGTEMHRTGFVYLVKHGARAEYKIGKTYDPLRREGEVRIQLPEALKPVHYIETDDPSGVEAYWHRRFADRRKEGEWFVLSRDDVAAFRRWKRIA